MTLRPGGAKAKGSAFERQVASTLGGKRMPLSGAVGGGDVAIPQGSIWGDWQWECKARGRMSWTVVWQALLQAAQGKLMRQKPAVVVKEDRGRAIFVAYLDDVVEWGEALAEMGNAHRMKDYLRQIQRVAKEAEELC